jgi:integrase
MEKLAHEADGPMKLLVVLASQTELRRSELARLTWQDMDLDRKVLPEKKGYSLQSLRQMFCTRLAEAGVPVHVIKGLAGHASIDTTMRYVHSISDARGHVEGAFG